MAENGDKTPSHFDNTFSITGLAAWLSDRERAFRATSPELLSVLFWFAATIIVVESVAILLAVPTPTHLASYQVSRFSPQLGVLAIPLAHAVVVAVTGFALLGSPWKAWLGRSLRRRSPYAGVRVLADPSFWSDVHRPGEFVWNHRSSLLSLAGFVLQVGLLLLFWHQLPGLLPPPPAHVPQTLAKVLAFLCCFTFAWALVGVLLTFVSISDRSAFVGMLLAAVLVTAGHLVTSYAAPLTVTQAAPAYERPDIRSPVIDRAEAGAAVGSSSADGEFYLVPSTSGFADDTGGWIRKDSVGRDSSWEEAVLSSGPPPLAVAWPVSPPRWWAVTIMLICSTRIILLAAGTFETTTRYFIRLDEFDTDSERVLFHARLPDKRFSPLPRYQFEILPGERSVAVLRRDEGAGRYRIHSERQPVLPTDHTYVVLNLSGIVAQDALDTKVTTPDGAFELVIDMRIDAQSPATLGMEGRAIQLDVAPTNWVIEAFFHNQPRQGYVNVLGPAMSHVIQKICAKRNLAGVHHLETECNNLVTYIERNEQQFFQVAMSEDQSLAQKSASVHGSVEQRLAGIQQQYNQLRDFLASSELQDVLQLEQEVILKEALRDIYDEEDFARYESTINVFQHILNLKVAHVTCQPIEGDQSPISRYRAALDRAIVSANGYLTRSGQVVELLTRLRAVYSRAEMEALLEAFRRGSRSYEQLMDELRRRMEHPHEDRQDEHHEDGHHEDEHHEDEHHEDEV